MPLPINSQYAPPKSWEEFEDLCCDLYALIWNDPGTQKHGRQGQPQGGVDVYGMPNGKHYTGVQCKKKSTWPPTELTTDEIDEEVEKAKTWEPGLKHFIIATTAGNDQALQKHARLITAAHKKKKLFSVEVASWDHITRRLTNYKPLLQKYGYIQDFDPAAIKLMVSETLRLSGSGFQIQAVAPTADSNVGAADALERDLAARYTRVMRRSFFPEPEPARC